MTEVVNLRTVRKRARRREDAARADANRLSHGQPKHIRDLTAAQRKKASRDLELRQLERDDGDGR
jgi:hypothetical protein